MTTPGEDAPRSLGDRAASVLRDIRSLGIGAPLRAGYEASKRVGGHSFLYRRLVPTAKSPQHLHIPLATRPVPLQARNRTIGAADRILGGIITLFGCEFQLEDPPQWHSLIHARGEWPEVDWWQIDLRSDARPGDVKWTWELGRHRHLVVLARAVYLEPTDARYSDMLNRQLDDWMSANVPERGVHWYSNLEISLRAVSWLQILSLARSSLLPDVRSRMIHHLHHAARHLMADLPYTVSTMRNNHLLGDALGLIALGAAFQGRNGDRWRRIGDRIFTKQLERHMRRDGSMIEDSVSYHRFVLEMLSMRVLLGEAPQAVMDSMRRAAQFLARLGVLEGPVPQYGDWDEGRVFMVADDPLDLAGSVRLALSLAGDGAPAAWREQHDEVAFFVSEGTPVPPQAADTSGDDLGAGIARTTHGSFTVWVKGGSGPSHGHADLSSVAIAHGRRWLIGDPGTGAYNGPIEIRNHFRGSAAHNVLRVEDIDQLEPHRAFRWLNQAQGRVGEPVFLDGAVIMWTVHNAYERLSPPRRVARVVIVGTDGVEVSDHVEGPSILTRISLTLHPDVSWNSATSEITLDGHNFHLHLPSEATTRRGETSPYRGWWSDTYGDTRPTTVLDFEGDSTNRTRWAIRESQPRAATTAADHNRAGISVRFDPTTTHLRVEEGERTILRSL